MTHLCRGQDCRRPRLPGARTCGLHTWQQNLGLPVVKPRPRLVFPKRAT
jgi:hypothetical protein